MRHVCLLGLFLILSGTAVAQYSVGGMVRTETGNGIPRASVQVLNSNQATSTDDQGNFRLEHLSAGTHMIRVSAVGYAAENHTISVHGDATLDIQLAGVETRLDEVVATAQKMESDPHDIPASLSVVGAQQIEQ